MRSERAGHLVHEPRHLADITRRARQPGALEVLPRGDRPGRVALDREQHARPARAPWPAECPNSRSRYRSRVFAGGGRGRQHMEQAAGFRADGRHAVGLCARAHLPQQGILGPSGPTGSPAPQRAQSRAYRSIVPPAVAEAPAAAALAAKPQVQPAWRRQGLSRAVPLRGTRSQLTFDRSPREKPCRAPAYPSREWPPSP